MGGIGRFALPAFLILAIGTIKFANSAASDRYLGCYEAVRPRRAMGVSPGNYDPYALTPSICMTECGAWGYDYAALTQKLYCFCSMSPPSTLVGDGACDEPCSGSPSEACGGLNHISVYRTILPIRGLMLGVAGSDAILTTGESLALTVGVISGPPLWAVQLDFGEDGEWTPENDTTKPYGYVLPGEYQVTARAIDTAAPFNESSDAVNTVDILVQTPVRKVNITCPEVVMTTEEFRCNASVLVGSFLDFLINFGDGSAVENFSIADPVWHVAGTGIPQTGVYVTSSMAGTLYVMPNADFQKEGTLIGWEFHASATGGLQFLVLRPTCASGTYCFKSNLCTVGTCGDVGLYDCNSGGNTVFCPTAAVCYDGVTDAGCAPAPLDRYATPPSEYSVVAVVDHVVSAAGWGYIDVDLDALEVAVAPGDVIGYVSSGTGLLSTRPLRVGEAADKSHNTLTSAAPGGAITDDFSDVGERHLLRSVVARRSEVLLFHTYDVAGVFTVTGAVHNHYITSTETTTTQVTAMTAIDSVIIDSLQYFASGSAMTFDLLPHTGESITYTWNFNDSTPEIISATALTTHTFSSPGQYHVTIGASNLLSEQHNSSLVIIQDAITIAQLESNVSAVGVAADFRLTLTDGSDYQCVWEWADGSSPNVTDWVATPPSGGIVSHAFPAASAYAVTVTCSNNVSSDAITWSHPVEDAIVNLRVLQDGGQVNEPLTIEVQIDQGTTPSFVFSFDGTAYPVTYDAATLTGTVSVPAQADTGIHVVTVTASNQVDTETVTANFTVESAITGLSCAVDKTQVFSSADRDVQFSVTMNDGTSVVVVFDFGDGTNFTHALQPLERWTAGSTFSTVHNYTSTGEFSAIVTASNSFSTHSCPQSVYVFNKVSDLEFVSNSPIAIMDGAATVLLGFKALNEPPTLASIEFDYGDGKPTETYPFQLWHQHQFPHTYFSEETYVVTANVSNSISWQVFNTTVRMALPILDMFLHMDPPDAAVGRPVKAQVTMADGIDVTLIFDFGDGTVISRKRTATSFWEQDTETHVYTAPGTYDVTVTGSNVLGNTSRTYTIVAQHPVTRDFALTSTSPLTFPPGTVTYTLTYPLALTLPQDATIQLVWGDGTWSDRMTFDPDVMNATDYIWTFTHTYSSAGDYQTNVILENRATEEVFSVSSGVYKPLTVTGVTPMYQPFLPINGPLQPGIGPNQAIFANNVDILFVFDVTSGTPVGYELTAVHRDSGNVYTKTADTNPAPLQLQEVGVYDVSAKVWNPISSSGEHVVTVETRLVVGDVSFSIETQAPGTNLNQPRVFTVNLPQLVDDICLSIDFGDGSDLVTYAAASASGCGAQPLALTSTTISVQYIFHGIKLYTVTLRAWNALSEEVRTVDVTVSKKDCSQPTIGIDDRAPNFWQPHDNYRKDITRAVGYTELLCFVLDNVKRWTVERVSEETGDVQEMIDLSEQSTAANTELALPPHFLQYGLYRLTFSVEMRGPGLGKEDVFRSEVSTFIRIVESPLVALLMPGSMSKVSRGHGTIVTLDPEEHSFDPDVESNEDSGFTAFDWSCRQIFEEYTLDPDNSISLDNMAPALTSAQLDAGVGLPSKGGCFRNGPGVIGKPSGGGRLTAGQLTFDTRNMLENEAYEFKVVVRKGDRQATTVLRLDIVPGNPPPLVITCKNNLCTPNEDGVMVNPSNRLALEAVCSDSGLCSTSTLTYRWSMDRAGLNEAWLEIPDFASYIEGVASSALAISPALFERGFELYPLLKRYRLRLTASSPGGTEGESYTILTLNMAPSGGSCAISPPEGVVMTDQWNITCWDWVDSNGVANYQFFASFKDDVVENQLGFGPESSLQVDLPLGPYYDEYRMNVSVRIYDTLGAVTEHWIGNVKVTPMNARDLDNQIDHWLSTIDTLSNKLSVAAAEEQLQEANSAFLEVASALNSARKNDQTEYCGSGSSASTIQDGYTLSSRTPCDGTVDTSLSEKERSRLVEEAEVARDSRAKLRTVMLESLEKVTKSSINSIQLTSSTLNRLCDAIEEVSRPAQEAVTRTLADMSQTLTELSTTIPLEELETAVASMVSTAGKLLQAAAFAVEYGLIADRELAILSIDYFYDSDLDSKRKRLDFGSIEEGRMGLQYETNTIQQRKSGNETVTSVMATLDTLTKLLRNGMVPGEQERSVVTDQLSLSVHKTRARDLTGKTWPQGLASFSLPDFCDMASFLVDCSSDDVIGLRAIATKENIFRFLDSPLGSSVPDHSGTLTLDLDSAEGQPIVVKDAASDIVIFLPRDTDSPSRSNVTAIIPDDQDFFFHKFNVSLPNWAFNVEIIPEDKSVQLLVAIRYDDYPSIGANASWEYLQTVPKKMADVGPDMTPAEESYQYNILLNHLVIDNRLSGPWVVGVRQVATDEIDRYDADNPPAPPAPLTGRITTPYTIRVWMSSCLFLDSTGDWAGDGCWVGPTSTIRMTECRCNHLTSFGTGWVVQPNTIDFDYVFSNAEFYKNPTIYITIAIIGVIYLIGAIWAFRKDKKDLMKRGVTPLPDNDPADKYFYEVVVQTGMRKNAGTDSKVHFILSGENDETEVRVLEDDKRKILRRGMGDRFLLATPRPLGPLSYARIWHDNSGKGKFQSWYLNYIIVHDLQTAQKSFFVVNQWFAVEEDDGQVDRLVPIASQEQMTELNHLFTSKAKRSLGDDHLWFSVVARPPQSRFTCLQRLSCCLLLLASTMVANALFYEKEADGAGQNALTFGPFALTPDQIYIGVVCNLIVFPINMLVVTLFRRARPRRKRTSTLQAAIDLNKSGAGGRRNHPQPAQHPGFEETNLGADLKPIMEREETMGGFRSQTPITDTQDLMRPLQPGLPSTTPPSAMAGLSLQQQQQQQQPEATQENLEAKKKKKKKAFSLPWWFTAVAWLLLWAVTLTCIFFTILFGISFGDLKTRKWITSMVISFMTSIFLTQPIKVFLLALFFSLIFKKTDHLEEEVEEEDEEEIQLSRDDQWLHPQPGQSSYQSRPKNRKLAYNPPDPELLKKARELRLKELQMYDILREILFYAIFLWILLVISYGFRDPNAFYMKKNIQDTVTDLGLGEFATPQNSFTKARTFDDFWDWTVQTLAPATRAELWYNGDPPIGQRGFLHDRVSRIMGFAVMRQLRVENSDCVTVHPMGILIPECYVPYSMGDESRGNYGVGWQPLAPGANESLIPAYTYTSADTLEGWPFWGTHAVYSGGGYAVELKGSTRDLLAMVKRLRREEWIDRKTRAIFVEFTVYNPYVNLFGIVTLVAEFIQSGGMHSYIRVEPMNLLGYVSDAMLFQWVCQAVFLCFIVFFIVKEIRKLLRNGKAYFKEPWNYIELLIIVLSVTGTVVYFYRFVLTKEKTAYFAETHGNEYMKFQFVAYWNELLLYMVGWLVFLATVKFIRLLRFNRRMSILAQTLRVGAKPLLMFGIIFGIVFMAYSQFFYMIYFLELENFSNIIYSVETCLQMLVGKFNFNAMQFASPVLGPLFFFCYVVTVYYILINMFLTILNESFSSVRHNIELQPNEYEMVNFIMGRFAEWTGLKNLFKKKKADTEDVKGPIGQEKKNGIEQFPETVDRLMDCISKVYFDQDTFEALFYSASEGRSKHAMKSLMKSSKKHAFSSSDGGAGSSQAGAVAYDSHQYSPPATGSGPSRMPEVDSASGWM